MSSLEKVLSVVVCTYNGENYVAEQLRSIQVQTHTNLDIVVCDDASTDRTAAIVQSFAATDARIRFFQNPQNLGFNQNFEKALRLAKGEWIAIADQDDLWLPQKIATLAALVSPDTWLIHSNNADFHNDDPSVRSFNPSRLRFEGRDTKQLLLYNTVAGHTILLHKDLLAAALPFPATVYYDWWLGVIASLRGPVRLCPEVLVLHRQHPDNASQQRTTNEAFFAQHMQMLQTFLSIPQLPSDDAALLRRLVALLQRTPKGRFSLAVFFFFLQHAGAAFYYRKKRPVWFYHLKYSFQKATMNQRYWP